MAVIIFAILQLCPGLAMHPACVIPFKLEPLFDYSIKSHLFSERTISPNPNSSTAFRFTPGLSDTIFASAEEAANRNPRTKISQWIKCYKKCLIECNFSRRDSSSVVVGWGWDMGHGYPALNPPQRQLCKYTNTQKRHCPTVPLYNLCSSCG